MEEQIFLKTPRSGTSITYFSTQIVDDGEFDLYPAYARIDSITGDAIAVHLMDGSEKWTRNADNTFSLFDESQPYLTGSCFFSTTPQPISYREKEAIRTKFVERMQDLTPTAQSYVLFEDTLIDDMHINIKLERSFDVLNTMNIYNRAQNEWPTQSSPTGVIIGRLEALQEILDENGNKVRIPLRNVPIGIFNESEAFPTISSVDEDGDRIRLNLKENSLLEADYFNRDSWALDTSDQFSKSLPEDLTNTPDQFKYVTITNQHGEFIIYDVPVGNQVLFFEVDLLKQGLTKDEVALNFFPYPTDTSPNVDRIPHFLFRQIPIDVFPAWGDFQTGYTEINISANIDLRKWATYYIPPVVYGGEGFQVNSMEMLPIYPGPISLAVRDMTVMGDDRKFKNKNIRMVQVPSIDERDGTQQLMWQQEFAQTKNKATFYSSDWQVIKLPANLYDPLGYRTNSNGIPHESIYHKGVWLSAYQFKLWYTDEKEFYRCSGMARIWDSPNHRMVSRDHYHMNYSINQRVSQAEKSSLQDPYLHLDEFPYVRTWTINYPVPYSIPRRPTQKNYGAYDQSVRPYLEGKPVLEVPYYKDGDLVGENLELSRAFGCGGASLNQFNTGSQYEFVNNNFSSKVTKSYIYRYDHAHYSCLYSNGYTMGQNISGFTSEIVGVEKYQRVECGYGYALWPEGMYRIGHHPIGVDMAYFSDIELAISDAASGDLMVNNTSSGNNTTNLPSGVPDFKSITAWRGLSFYGEQVSYRHFALRLDPVINVGSQHGELGIYRVIHPTQIAEPVPAVNVEQVTLIFGNIWVQRGYTNRRAQCKHEPTGSANQDSFYKWNDYDFMSLGGGSTAELIIKNNRAFRIVVNFGGAIEDVLEGGEEKSYKEADIGTSFNYLNLKLTTNTDFDLPSNTYKKCDVTLRFQNVRFLNPGGGTSGGAGNYSGDWLGESNGQLFQGNTTYYAVTKVENILVSSDLLGREYNCNGNNWNRGANVEVNGILLENSFNTYGTGIKWRTSQVTNTCTVGGIGYYNLSV